MADARNFLLNTDYPLDKIVYLASGSFSCPGGGGAGATSIIPHLLPFRPLVTGSWSTSSNFAVSKEMFYPVYTDLDGIYTEVFSNDTNITLSAINYTGSAVTIYWRVYGFIPKDADEDALATSINADKFVLNTDYNYTKLYYNEIIPAAATTTITHNFGYRPQIMAWAKDLTAYGTGVLNQDYTSYITVTDTTVVVKSATKDVHLRIYADSQV